MRCHFWKCKTALPAGHILPCNPSLCWQRQKRGFRQEASQLCAKSSSSSLKSLHEQTGSGCSDEISSVCSKLRQWRTLGSREALAACVVFPGTGNYWELPLLVPSAHYSYRARTCSNRWGGCNPAWSKQHSSSLTIRDKRAAPRAILQLDKYIHICVTSVRRMEQVTGRF